MSCAGVKEDEWEEGKGINWGNGIVEKDKKEKKRWMQKENPLIRKKISRLNFG